MFANEYVYTGTQYIVKYKNEAKKQSFRKQVLAILLKINKSHPPEYMILSIFAIWVSFLKRKKNKQHGVYR